MCACVGGLFFSSTSASSSVVLPDPIVVDGLVLDSHSLTYKHGFLFRFSPSAVGMELACEGCVSTSVRARRRVCGRAGVSLCMCQSVHVSVTNQQKEGSRVSLGRIANPVG